MKERRVKNLKKLFFVIILGFFFQSATHMSVKTVTAAEKVSFTVVTNKVVYDETNQTISIPVKPNNTVTAANVKVVLTYGWDGHGSAQNVIGEIDLTNVHWVAGEEYVYTFPTVLSINEIKSKNKVDLVTVYDGQTTITENLRPSQWTVINPAGIPDTSSSDSNTSTSESTSSSDSSTSTSESTSSSDSSTSTSESTSSSDSSTSTSESTSSRDSSTNPSESTSSSDSSTSTSESTSSSDSSTSTSESTSSSDSSTNTSDSNTILNDSSTSNSTSLDTGSTANTTNVDFSQSNVNANDPIVFGKDSQKPMTYNAKALQRNFAHALFLPKTGEESNLGLNDQVSTLLGIFLASVSVSLATYLFLKSL